MLRSLAALTCFCLVAPMGHLAYSGGEDGPDAPPEFEVRVVNENADAVPVVQPFEPIWITANGQDANPTGLILLDMSSYQSCVGVQPVCESNGQGYSVPEDRLLIIESVSVVGFVTSGTGSSDMAARLNIKGASGEFAQSITFGSADVVLGESNPFQWEKHFTTSTRVPPGGSFEGQMYWTGGNATGLSGNMAIQGRLVPLQ